MAESIPGDAASLGDAKEREVLSETSSEKSPKKVPHTQREKKVAQRGAYHSRRQFYNTDYHHQDNQSSEDREKVKKFRHPHRDHWQSWDERGRWLNEDTPKQHYYNNSSHSADAQHYWKGSKRAGHKSAELKQAELKQASSQDGVKKERKKTTEQQSASIVTDDGEKIVKKKPVKADVAKTADKETIDNSVTGEESGDKVKGKPDASKVEIIKTGSTAEVRDQSNDTSVPDKEKKVFKKRPGVKNRTSEYQAADNLVVTDKRGEKIIKKKNVNKGEIGKTDDRLTAVKASNQTDNQKLVRKDKKQSELIADNDKASDKDVVIMVGKYQVKKFRPTSTPNVAVTDEDTSNLNSNVTSDKTANQTVSTHSHRKRVYYSNKATKGSGRHNRGVVVSLQSDVLSQQLTTGQYECMVCCDRVRVKDPVWSCSTCYHIFHLKCIKKWAKIPTSMDDETSKDEGWRCPGCRTLSLTIPSVYKCFCGKMIEPVWTPSNKFQVPHSCGELCGKRLATDKSLSCMHKCRLLCHPGPCPPCPVTVTTHCPCGKKPVQVRCSDTANVASCSSTCDKQLACGRHHCKEQCHTGPCERCCQPITLHCYCGKHSKESICAEEQSEQYSCGKRCSRLLDCGNHVCEKACHDGACDSCALLPDHVTHCPCGATPLNHLLTTSRTSCLDPIPTCNSVCRRQLPCSTSDEPHYCEDQCHLGECAVCDKESNVLCKCGKSMETVPCRLIDERKNFECTRVCNKKLTCGRHRCSNKCCVRTEHSCDRVCGKKLQCGCHFCQDSCHSGHCERCWEISYEELSCLCGAEVLYPPIPCGTKPPVCFKPCSRLHPCDHPVTHTCHSEEHCPPCTFLTERMCMGGHGLRKNIPCHMVDVSCGTVCGRELPCGVHKCLRVCHKDACLADGEVCQQPCTNKRTLCDHMCAVPCHPGKSCPVSKCKAMITIKCPCGRKCAKVHCAVDEGHAYQSLKSEQLNNIMMELKSGHTVSIHDVTLTDANKLECDEICAQEERNRKLAEALNIENPDISSSDVSHQYSLFLLEQARADINFILSVEDKLKAQIENTLKTNVVGQVTFSVMKANQRRVVHELAAHFMCDTYSIDPEPLRNVIAIVNKKSVIPSVMLSQAAQMKKVMPAPLKNVPREQPTSTMVTLGRSKDSSTTTQPDYSRKATSKSPVDYFADDV